MVEASAMTDAALRRAADAFYQAYGSRDIAQLEAVLDDDVSWRIIGPQAIMQICGQWRGKAAVIDWFTRLVPSCVKFIRLDRDCLMVDGDQSALLGRIHSRHIATGRTISHQVAHFARYRNGKLVSFCVINDSLDAAEQFIGRHIAVPGEAESHGPNLVAI
jgi:ketosteroid isomerase-like protein